MAIELDVIRQVRQRVQDQADPLGAVPPGVASYPDTVYQDALAFSLQKLSYDFDQNPLWTVSSLPDSKVFLLVKLTTIEMCYVRAGEQEGTLSAGGPDNIASISVPDLNVTEGVTSKDVFDFFMDLAERLQEEYDGELEGRRATPASSGVSVGVMTRERTFPWGPGRGAFAQDRRVPEQVVVPPPAITRLTTILDGSKVIFTWDAWLNVDFNQYQIWRGSLSGFTRHSDGATRVITFGDNQKVRHEIDSEPSGTHYYLIYAENRNGLFSPPSNEVSLTVP